jgi:hypothetical protein
LENGEVGFQNQGVHPLVVLSTNRFLLPGKNHVQNDGVKAIVTMMPVSVPVGGLPVYFHGSGPPNVIQN